MADKKRPPYTSAADLNRLFERMRTIGDPGTIDSKWVTSFNLASSQPEGVVAALKWLGVIEKDGSSTGVWNEIRASKAETLKRLMETAYADIFSRVDVEEASREDLEGAFISAYDSGSTAKLIKCFLALCEHAGIETKVEQHRSPGVTGSSPGKAAKPAAGKAQPKVTETTPPKRKQVPAGDGVVAVGLSLNIEIPANWSEEQVTKRIASVRRAVEAS
jgi:hypothetical protein